MNALPQDFHYGPWQLRSKIPNPQDGRKIFSGDESVGQYFGFESASAHEFRVIGIVSDAQLNRAREGHSCLIFYSRTL